jgi:alanyl-tRNA synthetase
MQFKGNRIPRYSKCLRLSGKHNDLEDVGLIPTITTMFEMLEIGHLVIILKDAIPWAGIF